jgi:hypothetical protein
MEHPAQGKPAIEVAQSAYAPRETCRPHVPKDRGKNASTARVQPAPFTQNWAAAQKCARTGRDAKPATVLIPG